MTKNRLKSLKYIPAGGALSGFFGGLSGHQGALRTAFLICAGLKKEVFVGSMVVSAAVVDISRLIVYGSTFFARDFVILKDQGGIELVIAGTLSAFLGAFIGSRLLKKDHYESYSNNSWDYVVAAVYFPRGRTDLIALGDLVFMKIKSAN